MRERKGGLYAKCRVLLRLALEAEANGHAHIEEVSYVFDVRDFHLGLRLIESKHSVICPSMETLSNGFFDLCMANCRGIGPREAPTCVATSGAEDVPV